MTIKAWITGLLVLMTLAGCSRSWGVRYDQPIPAEVSREWRLEEVISIVPESLKVSESYT